MSLAYDIERMAPVTKQSFENQMKERAQAAERRSIDRRQDRPENAPARSAGMKNQ